MDIHNISLLHVPRDSQQQCMSAILHAAYDVTESRARTVQLGYNDINPNQAAPRFRLNQFPGNCRRVPEIKSACCEGTYRHASDACKRRSEPCFCSYPSERPASLCYVQNATLSDFDAFVSRRFRLCQQIDSDECRKASESTAASAIKMLACLIDRLSYGKYMQ